MGATVLAVAIGLAVMAAAQTAKPAATSKPATAAAAAWGNSLTDAVAQSKKTGKPILAFFTGSDWCGWCMKLRAEVLDTPEFQTWAANHVILLELDFPRNKQLDAATKKQNQDLATKYEIKGYPTVVFIKADGTSLGQMGYMKGGAKTWTDAAQKIIDAAKSK